MGDRINLSEVSDALISLVVIYTTYIIEWNASVVKDDTKGTGNSSSYSIRSTQSQTRVDI